MGKLFRQFTGWISSGWRRPVFGALGVVLTLGLGLVWARRRAASSGSAGGPQAAPILSEETGEEIKAAATEEADSTIEEARRQAEADKAAARAKYGEP